MPSAKKTTVSLVILNYNGKELLKIILDSIKKLTFSDYETIVVDNASTDNSVNFLKKHYPKVRIIKSKKNLGYPAINLAVPKARGKYFFYLNNDMEVRANCIGQLLKVIESDDNIAMVSPKLVNFYNRKVDFQGTWISRSFYAGYLRRRQEKDNKMKEIPYSGCAMIRKALIKKIKYLFDPDYFLYAEDVDLGMRIRLIGMKTVYVPTSVIYHMERKTTTKVTTNARLIYLMERNLLITFFKTVSFKNILLLFPYVFIMRVLAILRDLLKLDFKAAFSRIKAILWIIFHIALITRKRAEVQKIRKVSDAYLLNIFNEKFLIKN